MKSEDWEQRLESPFVAVWPELSLKLLAWLKPPATPHCLLLFSAGGYFSFNISSWFLISGSPTFQTPSSLETHELSPLLLSPSGLLAILPHSRTALALGSQWSSPYLCLSPSELNSTPHGMTTLSGLDFFSFHSHLFFLFTPKCSTPPLNRVTIVKFTNSSLSAPSSDQYFLISSSHPAIPLRWFFAPLSSVTQSLLYFLIFISFDSLSSLLAFYCPSVLPFSPSYLPTCCQNFPCAWRMECCWRQWRRCADWLYLKPLATNLSHQAALCAVALFPSLVCLLICWDEFFVTYSVSSNLPLFPLLPQLLADDFAFSFTEKKKNGKC